MGIAFGLLRLSPGAFWSMTPREFSAAIDALGFSRRHAPGREDLIRLMQVFPDGLERADGR